MRKAILVYLICFFSVFPVYANDIDVRKVEINNQEYIAFTPPDAQYLLQLRINFPVYKEKIKVLEELTLNQSSQIKVLSDMTVNLNTQLDIMKDQNAFLQEELDKTDVWYKSPWLWGAIGIVLGCLATIGIAEAVN